MNHTTKLGLRFSKTYTITALLLYTTLSASTICNAAPVKLKPAATVQPASTASAQDIQKQMLNLQQKLFQMESRYNQRIHEMQSTIDTLKAQVSKTPAPSVDVPSATAAVDPEDQDIGEALLFDSNTDNAQTPSLTQGTTPTLSTNAVSGVSNVPTLGAMSRYQNITPDISVLGDFTGLFSPRSDIEGKNRFSMREAEIAIQSPIDPFSRADFFFSKPADESLELEEGYITLLSLPGGLQAKVGKFRSAIGRLNRIHHPELPQVDVPNVITNFFGPEGLVETGVNVSKILPTPWYSLLEVETANGDNNVMFGHGRFTKPLLIGHLKNFFEISQNRNLEVGFTSALGARGIDSQGRYTGVQGVDLTYRWTPPEIGKSFVWQTELLSAQLDDPSFGKDNVYGGYSFLEYQLSRRVFAGVRFDYSQMPLVANAAEYAVAPYINFWQSEFGRLRFEYKHTFRENGLPSDAAMLQYTATLGTHRPHPF